MVSKYNELMYTIIKLTTTSFHRFSDDSVYAAILAEEVLGVFLPTSAAQYSDII